MSVGQLRVADRMPREVHLHDDVRPAICSRSISLDCPADHPDIDLRDQAEALG